MARYSYLVFFVISHLLLVSLAKEEQNHASCVDFRCGKLGLIGFPFSNRTHPECGLMEVDKCNETVQRIQLGKGGPFYNITNIALDYSITLENQMFRNHLDSHRCNSLKNLTLPSTSFYSFKIPSNLTLFKCPRALNRTRQNFNFSCNDSDSVIYYNPPRLRADCSLILLPLNTSKDTTQLSKNTTQLFNMLTSVFSVQLVIPPWVWNCEQCYGGWNQCQSDRKEIHDCSNKDGKMKKKQGLGMKMKLGLGTGIAGLAIIIVVLMMVIIFWFKKKLSFYNSTESCLNIENFLRNYGSLAPKRYSYADIKKMTNSFKHKLGQGGYGSVYKGKLLDGRNVAVKVLNDSKGKGEEFMNEVASISRTSHVNIVTLSGFCFEGRRRALIYEFVSNGSLEKFIYGNSSPEANHKLTWENLYQIAVGIARGLEYLHRGCNTRILHFDIKPHNILLDENFCPKISDFGLAKICHRKESIVSMTGARGTVGYIAPEIFCRNIGEVSYKSDVYSYGMMVFEMTGGRKNNDAGLNGSSDVYFPHWIYKHLETDEELGFQGIESEEDNEYARKMIIVSLWCIQTNPSIRPTMSRVVEMLEGSLDSLQFPPKPFLSSPGSPAAADTSTLSSMLTL